MSINVCNDRSMASITSLPSGVSGSSLVLLSTQTASSSATIDFTSNIDSTYDSYVFKFINMHPATNSVEFSFNMSTDSGSNYNVTKTTTHFRAFHSENDADTALAIDAGVDLAQSTSFQPLGFYIGNNNDDNLNGTLQIFNPSSNTFVKHFISTTSFNHIPTDAREMNSYIAGYGNTTSAINAIQFKMSSGNIDSGTIKMYGVV
ncbi:hypothetical protein [uncultured virus]|uniref:Uncharacterized protein n=1 Tax=uncultured virus TaxID=340016 RepID=A0A218MLX7_9VIRU|nr:hypothetical protein [uncultured virus]